jgi:acetyl-CoA synthetase
VLLEGGVAPLQGVDTAIVALAGAIQFGRLRKRQQDAATARILRLPPVATIDVAAATLLDEVAGKKILADAGIEVPAGQLTGAANAPSVATTIGFPVAVKLAHADLPHKTEAGAVRLDLNSAMDVATAVDEIRRSVERFRPGIVADRFLVERMVPKPVVELLVGIRHDPLFGPVMLVGAGGTMVEIWRDTATLLLPTDPASILEALLSLRIAPIFKGFRGAPAVDFDRIVDAIGKLAAFGHAQRDRLVELDVNPLMVLPDRAVAADVVLRMVGAASPSPRDAMSRTKSV